MDRIASVYILTGFLDSGKTTLLSRMIKQNKKKTKDFLLFSLKRSKRNWNLSLLNFGNINI